MRRYIVPLVALATARLLPGPVEARDTTPLRLGSYNIRAAVSADTFRAAVTTFADRVDVMSLQEVNRKEKEAAMAALEGWSYYRGRAEGWLVQVPVMWRSDRYQLASGHIERISEARFIGNELPKFGEVAGARYATVVRLVNRSDGSRIAIVNGHTVPGACSNGRPVKSRPRLLEKYVEEVRSLARIGSRENAGWGTVFVTGDLNCGYVADRRRKRKGLPFRTFRAEGLHSMWITETPGDQGSRGKSLLDNVYSPLGAVSAKVQFDLTWSDHRPVIATYVL